jgi:hypothetical protein
LGEEKMNDTETQSLFEQVGQYLQALDLNFDSSADEVYIGMYEGVHMTWRIFIRTDSESELRSIRVSSALPVKAPTNVRVAMAELMARVNYGLGVGMFDFDMDDGAMTYCISIELLDGALTKSMLSRMVSINMDIVDEYAPTFNSVMYGGVSPKDAFKAYEELRTQGGMLQ